MICPSTIIMAQMATNSAQQIGMYLKMRGEPDMTDMAAASMAAAQAIADEADKVMGRMWFWCGVGEELLARPLAVWIIDRLTDRLDAMTSEMERLAPA